MGTNGQYAGHAELQSVSEIFPNKSSKILNFENPSRSHTGPVEIFVMNLLEID